MTLISNKLSLFLMLCIAGALISCVKQVPVPEQAEKVLVVNGFLETGLPVNHIHLSGLNTGDGINGVSGLDVHISDGETTVQLQERADGSGFYDGEDTFIIQYGRNYFLEFLWNGKTVTAQTKSTPLLQNLSVSKPYLDIEQGNDLIFLEWEGLNQGSFNEYFYLVTIQPLANVDDLEYINRAYGEQSTPRTISLTYNPELTLVNDFFNYYGEHLIQIRAISKEHEGLFRAQLDYSQNAPGNIMGAAGFFVGTSFLSTVIDIR
jgi:hypothetical protein